MNHKRKRAPNRRAGCKMCKPQKASSACKTKYFLDNHKGGWHTRAKEVIADREIKEKAPRENTGG